MNKAITELAGLYSNEAETKEHLRFYQESKQRILMQY